MRRGGLKREGGGMETLRPRNERVGENEFSSVQSIVGEPVKLNREIYGDDSTKRFTMYRFGRGGKARVEEAGGKAAPVTWLRHGPCRTSPYCPFEYSHKL